MTKARTTNTVSDPSKPKTPRRRAASTPPSPPIDSTPSDQIAAEAYALFLARNGQHCDPLSDWLAAEPDPLAPHAARIIAHRNQDHRDALPLYCRAFSKGTAVSEATMTGIDRYGFEMSATTPEGPRPIRLGFADLIITPTQARQALVAMLHEARVKLGTNAET